MDPTCAKLLSPCRTQWVTKDDQCPMSLSSLPVSVFLASGTLVSQTSLSSTFPPLWTQPQGLSFGVWGSNPTGLGHKGPCSLRGGGLGEALQLLLPRVWVLPPCSPPARRPHRQPQSKRSQPEKCSPHPLTYQTATSLEPSQSLIFRHWRPPSTLSP